MLKFNNSYFVDSHDAAVDSLFNSNKTTTGIYKKYKHFILLSDLQGNPICYIQANGMMGNACKNGSKIFRQYGLSSSTTDRFFPELKNLKPTDQDDYIKNIYNSI